MADLPNSLIHATIGFAAPDGTNGVQWQENLTHWRLHYEFNVLAMQNPAECGRYMKGTSLEWQKLALEALSEPIRSATMATLVIAVLTDYVWK
jgi:hypothetical protein